VKVVHVELGRHLYGGARQVAYLLDGLARFPGRHVLACVPGAEVAGAIANPAVAIRPLRLAGDLDLGFTLRLKRLLRAEGADLLHVHSRKGDLPAILAGRLAGVPVVFSRRVDNAPNRADLWLKFPLCTRIVTISQGIREVLAAAGVAGPRIACIPSAIDVAGYDTACERAWFRAEFALEEEAPVLGVVAQLIPRKGHTVLFEALARLLPDHPRLKVLLFGQGPMEEELRRAAARLGLERNVQFAGFRADLPRILPCLSALVHPAWMEGLGVSLLEAAACGVPIVASRAGGMPEIVQDGVNGFLIEPGDSAGLAERLGRLLEDPALAVGMGRAGRLRVLERFAVERMVEGNYALYREILAAGRNTGSETSP
jgi:glycosyltransferase involved in cell wall biosynthesis